MQRLQGAGDSSLDGSGQVAAEVHPAKLRILDGLHPGQHVLDAAAGGEDSLRVIGRTRIPFAATRRNLGRQPGARPVEVRLCPECHHLSDLDRWHLVLGARQPIHGRGAGLEAQPMRRRAHHRLLAGRAVGQ